jgi:drug/metabolite transporter (DMT)-like permease
MASMVDESIAPDRAPESVRTGLTTTDALLVLMSLIWGANYTVVKYGTGVMDAEAYNGVRVALAAVVLVVMAFAAGARRASARDLLIVAGLGVLGNGIYQWLFAEGVSRTRAGDAALLLAAAPAFIALIGRVLGVERIHARTVVGIALSIGGIALVVFGGEATSAGRSTLAGNLLCFVGAIAWSLYTVLLKPYTHRVDVLPLSAAALAGGAVPLVVVATPAIARTSWSHVAPLTWAAIAYSGIGSLVVAYFFWYRGVRVLGPTRTALYSNLQPVIALLIAWAWLSEVPTPWQWAGAATIIGGVVLTRA